MWEVKSCMLSDVVEESKEGWEPFAVTKHGDENPHVWLKRRLYVEPKT